MYKIILQDYLKQIGQSQYWLAKKSRLTTNTLSKVCSGTQKQFRLDTMSKICNTLKCTPNDILADDNGVPFSQITTKNTIANENNNNLTTKLEESTQSCLSTEERIALCEDLNQLRLVAQQIFDMTDHITNRYFGKSYTDLTEELSEKSDSGDAK